MSSGPIVAIALLTRQETELLANTLEHCFPVEDDGAFDHLLTQLDSIEIEPLGKSIVIRSTYRR